MKKILIILIVFFLFSSQYLVLSSNKGYENSQTKEVEYESFVNLVISTVNNERSYMGLLPLNIDPIASYTAKNHSKYLSDNGFLSYCDLNGNCPDERYTIQGGTGAITEIIKGIDVGNGGQTINLTPLLASQFVEALVLSQDDSKILFGPYLTHVGFGFTKTQNRFVGIVEFVTQGGTFESLKHSVFLGEDIHIAGKINLPFIFKAVSLGFFDNSFPKHSSQPRFDTENISPYFPPQAYIAYGSTKKRKLLNFLKGLGVIGALGASPFTGGASAILAPVLLQSINSGPPREIPFKGGITIGSQGDFSGDIELNYQSMTGLYVVSILAELEGIDYPIVISRRTIEVKSPLEKTL